MSEIHLKSSIGAQYREEAEQLFFFNPKQAGVRDRVREHVERYGTPVIRCREGLISFELAKVQHAQTLFIMMGANKLRLVGMLVYVRKEDSLCVLYLALKPVYTVSWRKGCLLLSRVLDMLKKIAGCIKGIHQIQLSVASKDITFRL